MPFVWNGVLDPTLLADDVVSAGHRLADAAKVGDWKTVFELLDDPTERVDVNWWRPGGTAWFTVLHQAAWHGAPLEVVGRLIRRGALRSVTDSRGRTPSAVRRDRQPEMSLTKGVAVQGWKSPVLPASALRAPPSPLSPEDTSSLNKHLADVIDSRIRGVLFDRRDPRTVLRYPPVEILHEVRGRRVWFPVPGMYGGFDITLRQDSLDVKSWCRVVGGSGRVHLVTPAGAILVDEGFV
jgi:hypothetical protein